jgi:hypothetical protein
MNKKNIEKKLKNQKDRKKSQSEDEIENSEEELSSEFHYERKRNIGLSDGIMNLD